MSKTIASSTKKVTVIDVDGAVMGRAASIIAKRLLNGEEIIVVNAEKAIISGKRKRVLERYRKKITEWVSYYNPKKNSPKFKRRPDLFFKRVVRGMLPWKTPKGRQAYKRLRVYIGFPESISKENVEKLADAKLKNTKIPFVTLEELYRLLAGRVIE